MSITQLPSPNLTPGSQCPTFFGMPRTIEGITIHWWDDPARKPTFDGTVTHLRNPASKVSAHYVVQAGRVAQLVQDVDVAWHAGSARGNATTIGIECSPYATDSDYQTIAELIRLLRRRHGNLPLYRHSDWTPTACPGTYDLARLDALTNQATPTVQPAATPVVRIVGPAGVRYREEPNTQAKILTTFVAGAVTHWKGYVTGEDAYGDGRTAWLVGAYTGKYAHVSGFTDQSLTGLPRL